MPRRAWKLSGASSGAGPRPSALRATSTPPASPRSGRIHACRAHQRLAFPFHAVQQGVDKGTPLALVQVDLNLAEIPLKLVDYRLQRMALPIPAQGHLSRAIDTHNQNPLPLEPPPQMEQQVD